MKLTRTQLRKLIQEAMIKPSIPGLDSNSYGKALNLARHKDSSFQRQADDLAGSLGYPGSFSGDIDKYDNPVTRETIAVGDNNIEKEVVIPRYLVDAVVNAYQLVLKFGETDPNDPDYDLTYDFREAAQEIFSHIERDVQPDYVNSYGLSVRGYRAKEYQDAMFAVGEYL